MAETPRSTNPVEIGFGILGKVKIDHYIHRLDINSTGEEIRTDKIAIDTVAEIVKYSIPIMLQHLRMGVKAGIAKIDNLLRKKLYAVRGVAEYDRLVDLKPREESVETMDLLTFVNVAVILRYAS